MLKEPQPKQYMDVNTFLDLYLSARADNDTGYIWFANMANHDLTPGAQRRIAEYLENPRLGNRVKRLATTLLEAAQDQDDPVNGENANYFTTLAATMTVFDADNSIVTSYDFATNNILRQIRDEKIKNPEHAYKLLKLVRLSHSKVADKLHLDVWHAIIQNPLATANDACEYCQLTDSLEDILGLINDYDAKAFEIISTEQNKGMVNEQKWNKLFNSHVSPLYTMVNTLIEKSAGKPQMQQTGYNLLQTFRSKYDEEKILSVEFGNYVQQYKDQAEIKLAKMEPELQQARQDLQNAKETESNIRTELDTAYEQVQKLKDELKQKEIALYNAGTKYDDLRNGVNTYIHDAEERSNSKGIDLTRGKDLTKMLMDFKKGINTSK